MRCLRGLGGNILLYSFDIINLWIDFRCVINNYRIHIFVQVLLILFSKSLNYSVILGQTIFIPQDNLTDNF